MLLVNPNLCFDRTLRVDEFAAGTVSRPTQVVVSAGGKGVNVARTVRDLGIDALLLGPLPQIDGDRLADLISAEGLRLEPVPVAGAVRSATIVLEDSGRATVLNEPGPMLGANDRDRLLAAVASHLAEVGGPLVCSGSLPPGLPEDTVAALIEVGHRAGVRVVIDVARGPLAAALPVGPDLVLPNLAEAEGLVSGRVTEDVDTELVPRAEVAERAAEAAVALVARGARAALVTAGGHGACAFVEGRSSWIDAPRVRVINPIGAGDSTTAGVAAALSRGESLADAVRYGIVVASAAVEQPGAGRVDPARVEELLSAGAVLS